MPRGMAGAWPRRALAAATLALLRDRGALLRRYLITDVVAFGDGPALRRDLAARRRHAVHAVLRFAEDD